MEYDVQDYLFDLRGYLILRNVVTPGHVKEMNKILDEFPKLDFGQWHGNVQRFDNNGDAGVELQNIFEAGEPFERLIDNPNWLPRVSRYCGEEGCFMSGLFVDECFASIRRTGGFFPIHSGGHEGAQRTQYRFKNGQFHCGQINILLALTDIGPGDGGTIVIPGSHKSNFAPPHVKWADKDGNRQRVDNAEGTIEVHMNAGDCLLFVDALCHGASSRTNPGERRVVIMRYGPSYGASRYGYQYSQELLDRITPSQRKILQPIPPRRPPARQEQR